MDSLEFRQRRCKILRTATFWLKIAQMVFAVVAIVLCATYNQSAKVHMIDSHYYYSISLTFPFIYEPNITVQASPDLPLRKFTFDTLLLPSTIAFVAVTSLAFIVAIVVFIFSLTRHGLQEEPDYIKLNFFVSLGLTFVLLASICLWMTYLIALVQDVKHELDFLLNQCQQNHGRCVKNDPSFITLYISMAFGICLFLLWSIESIQKFIKMVYTIPAQITLTTLVRNVELEIVEKQ